MTPAEPLIQVHEGRKHHAHFWSGTKGHLPILALHGFTGSGADFAPLVPHLDRAMLAPDLMGHGHTVAPSDPEAYHLDALLEQMQAWLRHRSEDPWVLLGYSMGGRVAQRLAQQLGAQLAGLVLISTTPGIEDDGQRSQRKIQDASLADRIESDGIEWFCKHWASQPIIATQDRIVEPYRSQMQQRRSVNRAAGLAGSLRGIGQGTMTPIWDALVHLDIPTLILTGAEDVPYTSIGQRMANQFPNASLCTLSGAGHCAHLEQPADAGKAIESFLVRLERA